MRRFLLAFMLSLGLMVPAQAVTLLNTFITSAVTNVSPVFQIRPGPGGQFLPSSVTFQGNFTWGSGGTSVDAYVQTSIDGMSTWQDVAHFSYAGVSLRNILSVSSTPSVVAAVVGIDAGVPGTPLAVNTAAGGIFGNYWRVKYVVVGTYAGGTILKIDAIGSSLTTLP